MLVLALTWPPWWTWVLAGGLGVLAAIWGTSAAGPQMAAVGISPEERLLVRPVGLMRVWALSTGLDCPITSIVDIGVGDTRELSRGFRAPGTYLPGVMIAGTFRARTGNALWLVGRQRRVLVIELTDEKWRYLILGVEDPDAANEALRAALNRER